MYSTNMKDCEKYCSCKAALARRAAKSNVLPGKAHHWLRQYGMAPIACIVIVIIFTSLAPPSIRAGWSTSQWIDSRSGEARLYDIEQMGYRFYRIADSVRFYNGILKSSTSFPSFYIDYCPFDPQPERYYRLTDLVDIKGDTSMLALFEGVDCSIDGGLAKVYRCSDKGSLEHLFTMGACNPTGFREAALVGCSRFPAQIFMAYEANKFLYKSSDAGTSFRQWAIAPYFSKSSPDSECGTTYFSGILAVAPFDTNTVYVSGYGSGDLNTEYLYRTTDNGASWDIVFSFPLQRSSFSNSFRRERLYFNPGQSGHVCLRLDSALYRSTDGGTSWSMIWEGRPIHSVSISDWIAIGCDSGTVMRWDGSKKWQYEYQVNNTPVIGLVYTPWWMIVATSTGACEVYQLLDVSSETTPKQTAFAYPNPFSEEIRIQSPSATAFYDLVIVDVFGRPVYNVGKLSPGSSITWPGIDEAGKKVAPGMYACVWHCSTKIIRQLVIKQ